MINQLKDLVNARAEEYCQPLEDLESKNHEEVLNHLLFTIQKVAQYLYHKYNLNNEKVESGPWSTYRRLTFLSKNVRYAIENLSLRETIQTIFRIQTQLNDPYLWTP